MADPEGTTTAGNAPGVNDGASCVVVCSEEWARARGLEPLATILSQGYVADDFAPVKNWKEIDGDHDVFGDERVMVLSTPGHTKGHCALVVEPELELPPQAAWDGARQLLA